MTDKSKKRCPNCKKKRDAIISPTLLPFCSKKCKMADLGKWFSEDYSIPSNDTSIAPEDILGNDDDKR